MSTSSQAANPPHPTISAHRVEGTPVYNTRGERIGRIDDLMIEKVSGSVTSAILSFGQVFGLGGDRYPLPWSMLTYDVGRKGYVVDEERLKSAPTLPGQGRAESDLPWREDVYRYWAAPTYWV